MWVACAGKSFFVHDNVSLQLHIRLISGLQLLLVVLVGGCFYNSLATLPSPPSNKSGLEWEDVKEEERDGW